MPVNVPNKPWVPFVEQAAGQLASGLGARPSALRTEPGFNRPPDPPAPHSHRLCRIPLSQTEPFLPRILAGFMLRASWIVWDQSLDLCSIITKGRLVRLFEFPPALAVLTDSVTSRTLMWPEYEYDICRHGFVLPIVVAPISRNLARAYLILDGNHRSCLCGKHGRFVPAYINDQEDQARRNIGFGSRRGNSALSSPRVSFRLPKIRRADQGGP
jgi:hypothetical protein